jgi:hypothetical protein
MLDSLPRWLSLIAERVAAFAMAVLCFSCETSSGERESASGPVDASGKEARATVSYTPGRVEAFPHPRRPGARTASRYREFWQCICTVHAWTPVE